MPPHSRNHRLPTAGDTPAATPAFSLETPAAIAAQNRCRCSPRATGGRPGDRIAGRPVAAVAPRTHLQIGVLRRPLESAQFTSWAFTENVRRLGLLSSMGTVGDCYDNAPMESFWGSMQIELLKPHKLRTNLELAKAMAD